MLKWMGRSFLLLIAASLVLAVVAAMPRLLHSSSSVVNFLQLVAVSLLLEAAQFTVIGAVMMGRRTKAGLPGGSAAELWKARRAAGAFPAGVQQATATANGAARTPENRTELLEVYTILGDAKQLLGENKTFDQHATVLHQLTLAVYKLTGVVTSERR